MSERRTKAHAPLYCLPIALLACLAILAAERACVACVLLLWWSGYFLMLALLPFPEAAVAAVPLTGLGQVGEHR